jgi:hypothetical protein
MWWAAEKVECAAQKDRDAKYRQKRARRWVDQRLKAYYRDDLLPRSYPDAEAVLNRAIVETGHKGLERDANAEGRWNCAAQQS